MLEPNTCPQKSQSRDELPDPGVGGNPSCYETPIQGSPLCWSQFPGSENPRACEVYDAYNEDIARSFQTGFDRTGFGS